MENAANSPQSVTNAFVRALNRQDVEGMIALMSPAHRLIDSMGTVVEGLEKMRAGWVGYFKMVPDYALAIEETYESGPVVILLGVARGTYTRTGELSPDNHWHTPIALRAFVEDGLISEWKVFADNEPIRRLMKSA
ncbi:MAG TPA: nuclear transport factor 2 family protein [Terracidiphilus sp.]|jgi:ketosteroid isomerase-like protein|nr:nuclear transport factor 2 family protein [Terracidiphilus sp.]